MSNLSTLKQQVEEMQVEIERLEAEEREPEIPGGTLCWFYDDDSGGVLGTFGGKVEGSFMAASGDCWKNASIANDIPGVMIWEKHDGGPCPVGPDTIVTVSYGAEFKDNGFISGKAINKQWDRISAYAIINKAEWMQ